MSSTCLNCGTEIPDQFCPHCGQKKAVQKLTWQSLVQEIFYFFSHIERGFLKTSWQLLTRPGRIIWEYLGGKRKKYFKPISLYLIWTGIHLAALNLINSWMKYPDLRTDSFLISGGEAGSYVVHHSNLFALLLLPILAFLTWLMVSRPKMNYLETFVAGIYAFAALEMLIFLQIVITALVFQTNYRTNAFVREILIVNFIWSYYCFVNVFQHQKIKLLYFRVFVAQLISVIAYSILSHVIAKFILSMQG